jgi:hypothetical protein
MSLSSGDLPLSVAAQPPLVSVEVRNGKAMTVETTIWQAVIGALSAFIWWTDRRRAKDAEEVKARLAEADAARKREVEEVKAKAAESEAARKREVEAARIQRDDTHKKIEEVAVKTEKVYTLVNHPMGVLLKAHADTLEEMADIKRTPEAVLMAIRARKASDEHASKQTEVDKANEQIAKDESLMVKEFLERPKKVKPPNEDNPS